jgi:CRP/FNR family cyclic AMP-dependent transcriptional regulator
MERDDHCGPKAKRLMADKAFLRKIFLFRDLSEDEMEEVLSRTKTRNFPAEAVIIEEGERGDSMFIMLSGEVAITKLLILDLDKDAPKERMMNRLKAEDGVYFEEMTLFGEMSLLENEVRSATVTALSECVLLELHRNDFLDLIQHRPSLGVKLLLRMTRGLSVRLRKASKDLVKLTSALAISLGG